MKGRPLEKGDGPPFMSRSEGECDGAPGNESSH